MGLQKPTHPLLCSPAPQPSSLLCLPSLWWLVIAKRRVDMVVGSRQQGCSPLLPNPMPFLQLGQHPVDSGDPAGPGASDTQGNRQQQRETADAEHQCWLPVSENPHPTHGRGEAQQGERDVTGATAMRTPVLHVGVFVVACRGCESNWGYLHVLIHQWRSLLGRSPGWRGCASQTWCPGMGWVHVTAPHTLGAGWRMPG